MGVDTVAALVKALGPSKLLERAQLEVLTRDLQPRFTDVRGLARELIQRGWLTVYQVNQLLKGHGRDLVLGPYILLDRLGEGGMGEVFKARHQTMQRVVAIKLIRKERLKNEDAVRRFYREVRAAAQLSHPNVVTAFDASHVGDAHFFVMEYVEGMDLAKLVQQRGPVPAEQACDYIRQAALGLQHAFERGLVHRDIKPANLLVSGGVVSGEWSKNTTRHSPFTTHQVKLLDLGLARTAQEGAETGGATREGSVLGTPDYIAPEQAQEAHTVDIRADIYSLGCTLYFLLTGQPPFASGTLAQKLAGHMFSEPRPVEQLRPELPAGLPLVVRKLMAKKPEERYQTPAEVASVLEVYCRPGAPVAILVAPTMPPTAGPSVPATAAIATAPLRSAPVAVPVSAAVPASLGAPTTPTLTYATPSSGTIAIGRAPPRLGRRPRLWLLAGLGGCFIGLVATFMLIGKVGGPRPTASQTSKIPADDRFDWQPEGLVKVLGEHRVRHNAAISCMSLSGDGKLAAAAAGDDLRVSDAETLRERRRFLGHSGSILSVALSRDGKWMASGGADKTVRLWDVETGKELMKWEGHTAVVRSVAITADGQRVLSGGDDKAARLWENGNRKEVRQLSGHTTSVMSVAFAPNGLQAVTAGGKRDDKLNGVDCALRLWDVAGGAEVKRFEGHQHTVNQVSFAPDGRRLLSCAADNAVHVWDVETGKVFKTLAVAPISSTGPVAAVAFAPGGRHALACQSGGPDPKVYYWEVESARELRQFRAPTASVAFFPDGRRAVLACENTLRQWDTETGNELRPETGHTGSVESLTFSPDGRQLLSTGPDRSLRLWDVASGKELRRFPEFAAAYYPCTALSADNRYVLAAHPSPIASPHDKVLILYERENGRELRKFSGHTAAMRSVAFAPDSGSALSGGDDMSVRLWDVASGKEVRSFKGHTDAVRQVGFLPDGKQAYSAGRAGSLRFWEVDSGKELRRYTLGPINSTSLAPDGRLAFTGADNGEVTRWDLSGAEAKAQTFFKLHTAAVHSLSLAPDGKMLASAGADSRVVLWDPATGKKIREWQQPGGVTSVAFAPDSRHLATANNNTTVYILRLEPPARPAP